MARKPTLLCIVGLALYGIIFVGVFLRRDGTLTYEMAYAALALAGGLTAWLVAKGRPRSAIAASLAILVIGGSPFLFLYWVILPQGVLAVAAFLEWRRQLVKLPAVKPSEG